MNQIYLDHAAATPVDPTVMQAMLPYFTEQFYNPSALYGTAQQVHRDLESARSTVAQLVGARPVEITFTAGGTEANNLAITGVMSEFPGSHMLVSAVEHDSVLEAARQFDHTEVPVNGQGRIDIDSLRGLVTDDTVLVSVMYANNEVGTVQPIKDVVSLVAAVRKDRKLRGVTQPLYVHTDAAQAGNYLDIHVSRLGVDLMTLNGGKVYGPKQSGALYIRSGIRLKPLVFGGGQERGLRSGTENVAGAVGFAQALQIAQERRQDEVYRQQQLQHLFIDELQMSIPACVINGPLKNRLPNNVHVTIPGADNERLLFGLDEMGILAAAGSACSASSDEPSHVLKAMGISEAAARSCLRFSMGRSTTREQLHATVEALASLLA